MSETAEVLEGRLPRRARSLVTELAAWPGLFFFSVTALFVLGSPMPCPLLRWKEEKGFRTRAQLNHYREADEGDG